MTQTDPVLEKAKQLRAAGATIEEIKQYLHSKGYDTGEPDDTVEVEAGYPERLTTTVLKGAQIIPGMKSLEALAGSLGSKFTDTPVSYSDARAGLEEQTDRMKTPVKIAAQLAMAPALLPLMGATGLGGAGRVTQGAAIGGASEALDIDPDESLESRLLRAAVGTAAGAAIGGVTALPGVVRRYGPGLKGAAKELATPGVVRRTMRGFRQGMKNSPKALPTADKVAGKIAPKAEAETLEGLLGNSMDNVAEAQKAATIESRLIEAAKPTWKPRSATKARFDYFADRMAKREAAEATEAAEPSLEELLAASIEHLKKGGTLRQASDVASKVKR